MPKVEFVIIAFPKCGTTSLVDNLNKHSKINCYHDIGNNESILFHADTFYNAEKREKYEKYLVEGKINGEKNPTYIWNHFSLLNIHKYNPNMKVIICLRNPVDYIYSWYHQLYVNSKCGKGECEHCKNKKDENGNESGDENNVKEENNDDELEELEEQEDIDWNKILSENGENMGQEETEESEDSEVEEPESSSEDEENEENKHKIISFRKFYLMENQKENSYFVNHIIRAIDIFGEENIHYMVQEEYDRDNQSELNKIFRFLGLEEEELEGLRKFKGERPNGDMDEKTRKYLEHRYKKHNKNLFKIIGRNIKHWE